MPIGKYHRKPLGAVLRPIADNDPRNIFTQHHFKAAWMNLAGAIGRGMADEDIQVALLEQRVKLAAHELLKAKRLRKKTSKLSSSLSPATKKK